MKIEWGQKLSHLLWLENALQVRFDRTQVTWLAATEDDGETLLGVVVYSRFMKANCEMTVAAASPRFCSAKTLKAFFAYPFYQCSLARVTAFVAEDNAHSAQYVQRLGFKLEGRMTNWFGAGQSALAFGLLKEDCKWLD